MSIGKNLAKLTIPILLLTTSCGNKINYEYHGKIGGEYIDCTENDSLTLDITKTDGTKIEYYSVDYTKLTSLSINDKKNNDYFLIQKNSFIMKVIDCTTNYYNYDSGKEVLKVGEIQYKDYIKKILEVKKEESEKIKKEELEEITN